MSTTAVLTQPKQSTEITEKEVIKRLTGYVFERKRAIEVYPDANGAREKLQVIDEMLLTLDKAYNCISVKQSIILIINIRPALHFIAPRSTRKLHATWFHKIEQLMDGCREYLGWQKQ